MKILRLQDEYMESMAILAHKLWPSNSIQELLSDFSHILNSRSDCVLISIQENNAIGFAYFSLRNDYVEGTHSSPVAYIEGIFIEKDFRHRGYAYRLVDEGIGWAKKQGCAEMASDCELGNSTSKDFHKKIGFKEVNKLICYTRDISDV